jgi:hypothetical protein
VAVSAVEATSRRIPVDELVGLDAVATLAGDAELREPAPRRSTAALAVAAPTSAASRMGASRRFTDHLQIVEMRP